MCLQWQAAHLVGSGLGLEVLHEGSLGHLRLSEEEDGSGNAGGNLAMARGEGAAQSVPSCRQEDSAWILLIPVELSAVTRPSKRSFSAFHGFGALANPPWLPLQLLLPLSGYNRGIGELSRVRTCLRMSALQETCARCMVRRLALAWTRTLRRTRAASPLAGTDSEARNDAKGTLSEWARYEPGERAGSGLHGDW